MSLEQLFKQVQDRAIHFNYKVIEAVFKELYDQNDNTLYLRRIGGSLGNISVEEYCNILRTKFSVYKKLDSAPNLGRRSHWSTHVNHNRQNNINCECAYCLKLQHQIALRREVDWYTLFSYTSDTKNIIAYLNNEIMIVQREKDCIRY